MRFVDEYRDPVAARRVLGRITALAGTDRHYKFMEVCGGHTHTIYRHGIEHVLPSNVELVHGPGCPVCVIPMGRIDDAIAVAETPNVIFTSFGDMMRVPGGNGTLLEAKARGADVRFVYSPLDALKVAVDNPDRDVVFFAVGFETTAPSTAVTLLKARDDEVMNFSVFSNHVTIVPPIKAILESPDLRLDGFLGPGHVSTVVGNHPYRFVTQEYGKPLVTAGFEPLDILQAIAMLLTQIHEGRCEVENQYTRIVRDEGNPRALRFLAEVFELRPHFEWRGLGFIAQSALEAAGRVRAVGCGAALRGARRPGGRPEGLPVRGGAEGRDQALGVQGLRHCLHAGDADRDVHGVVRGRVRGVLQLRPSPPRGRRHPRPGVGVAVHELSLCQAILEHVEARAGERAVRRVARAHRLPPPGRARLPALLVGDAHGVVRPRRLRARRGARPGRGALRGLRRGHDAGLARAGLRPLREPRRGAAER